MTRQGTQTVFATSAPAPTKARPATKKVTKAATVAAPPSAQTAVGDLWSGVASSGKSPISAAEATAGGQDGGLGTGAVAGLAVLGLGVAGLAGAFGVATARRRAVSKSTR